MKALTPIALAVLMLAQPALAWTQSGTPPASSKQVSNAPTTQQLDKLVSNYYQNDQPGATVIVIKDGKTLLRKAYGIANLAKAEKLQADHVMRLGSITKQFTAVAILQLVEAGKLSLNDPVTRYFPDFPESAKQITVEHLLTHTSGIPSYTGKPGFVAGAGKDISVQEMLDSFKNDALEFEPGTAWKYNNSGYFLLGALIEKVSGESYANYVAKHLFEPLGMKHTAYENFERHPQMKALGYSKRTENFEPSIVISMTQPYAAGSLCSTVDDLAKWDAAVSAGKLLKAEHWKRAFTSYKLKNGQDTNYGYGWGVGQFEGQAMLSHGGGIPGFSTFALSLPKDHVYVAVLTNADGGLAQPEMVASRLAASAIGKPIPEFKAVKLDEKALDRFTGVYRIDDKNRRLIVREDDKLVMTRTDGPRTVMQAYSSNGFFKDNNSLLRVEFAQNSQGEVTGLTVHQNGTSIVHPKLNEALPQAPKAFEMSAEQFAVFEGDYQIQPNFILNVRREGTRYITQATGQGTVGIVPVSADTFKAPDVGAQLKFEKDTEGKVTQLILTQGGRDIPAKKVK
ncbi:serine hydrolase [Undibacterium sp. LX15W]|uniref:Serine hydrolase n=1 Tax=Undibacterium flavidum TaxID=2762297 RepID=A0ABR6YFY0_9BURK|nr:serine hydrolase [Undibacterium flavidum]